MPSVLIVDDNEGTLQSYEAALRAAGFKPYTALSGQIGLALARRRHFDVCFVDLRLSDMSGLDVIRQLKLISTVTSIILITAFPDLASAFDAGAAGADRYIDGPLFGDDLISVVEHALGTSAAVRQDGPDVDVHPPSSHTPSHPRVLAVQRAISSHLEASSSVGDLAALVQWSESTLSRRFHSYVGLSITEYRVECRLRESARRLVTSHQSVREIAYGVGYRSESLADFRKHFRKRFGMSPTVYRARFWRGGP